MSLGHKDRYTVALQGVLEAEGHRGPQEALSWLCRFHRMTWLSPPVPITSTAMTSETEERELHSEKHTYEGRPEAAPNSCPGWGGVCVTL